MSSNPMTPTRAGTGNALLPQGEQHVQGLVVAGKQQGGAGRRGPDQGADGGNIVRLGHHMGFETRKGGGRGPEALIPPPLGVDIDAGLLLLGGIDVDEAAVIPAGGVADSVAHGGLLPHPGVGETGQAVAHRDQGDAQPPQPLLIRLSPAGGAEQDAVGPPGRTAGGRCPVPAQDPGR